MASLEQKFEAATSAREIPGVVLLASNADGTFKYKKAIGPAAPNSQIELDSTFTMASCTKLITSISGLRCVEQGQIGLDDDLSSILTEFKETHKFKGVDENRSQGVDSVHAHKTDMLKDITLPLLFEPGTSWTYGYSLEWVSLLVTRLNNGQSLEGYAQTHIFSPLNINDITFYRDHNPHVQAKLVKMTFRSGLDNLKPILAFSGKGNGKVEWTDGNLYIIEQKDCWGGQGLAGSASSYLKILTSLLSDDEILLKKSTTTEIFKPQISEEAVEGIRASFVCADFFQRMFSSQIPERELIHGLGGLFIEEDIGGGKKKGTLTWSGMPNLLWSIDKEAGLACLYASNVLPFGDPKSHEMQQMFEKEMYKKFGEFQKTLK
ncbi:putative beta-lactamase family protein [Botrytis fragariae]|uniref:Putative beta-lactamase family protein n=1 Tax=Botrytis fragariae TaxID=1964551 RepID=A0A8H6AT63_9HELO|nr:putative beta-lactamase family protein [Botrytis fragariae]KAF5873049.1 putative beta-lactamase family protein [Botrytis fragariae]